MNHLPYFRITAASLLLASCAAVLPCRADAQAGMSPSGQTIAQRTQSLLSQMSVEEKIGQLSDLVYVPPEYKVPGVSPEQPVEESIAQGRIGSLLFVKDAATSNRLQHIAVEKSPHHIPLTFGFDVIHGFRTVFPVPLALAASWDPGLVTASQTIAAKEARSVGIDVTFSPMVDIARDPRWGRMVEGAGEDPYLGSVMAVAQVRGFQGDVLGTPDHLLATAKHFAGYGAAEGGRDYDAAYISDSQLRNVYLPPFKAAVDAGAGSVMSAYMDLNDVPATGNRWLLHDVLRDEWGFAGFVISDADAVKSLQKHGFARDEKDAAVRALHAGINMEMGLGHTAFAAQLPSALKEGLITQSQLDDAVRPILAMKFRMGLFDHPYVDELASKQILTMPESRVSARVAAERSAVLLRNEGALLPLKKDTYRHIAVIGPLADSKADTSGPQAFAQNVSESVTLLDGLRNKLGPSATISFAPGAQMRRMFASREEAMSGLKPEPAWTETQIEQERTAAVDLARSSDLVVMVLGEAQNMSGEMASQSSLEMPGGQEALLKEVMAVGKPVLLILMNGRPLNLVWAAEHVPAILEVWYPGSEGGAAVANLLFGDATPGGKLPFTWPRDVGQIPISYAHNTTQAPEDQAKRYFDSPSTPLFPFGYGLSYTQFRFSNLKIDHTSAKTSDTINVSVDVTNVGRLAGDEVVELYTHQQFGSASRPVRELKGFTRINLASQETRNVHFSLSGTQLAFWSGALRSWNYEPSVYDVWAGGDSDAPLHGEFSVTK